MGRHLWVEWMLDAFVKGQEGDFFFFFKGAICRSRKLISPTFLPLCAGSLAWIQGGQP